jgi:hypothetical protein
VEDNGIVMDSGCFAFDSHRHYRATTSGEERVGMLVASLETRLPESIARWVYHRLIPLARCGNTKLDITVASSEDWSDSLVSAGIPYTVERLCGGADMVVEDNVVAAGDLQSSACQYR